MTPRDSNSGPAVSAFHDRLVTRRQMVSVGGATLIATSLVGLTGCAPVIPGMAAPVFPHVETGPVTPATVAGAPVGTLDGGSKPIFVAPPGNLDPVAHSVADTMFWGDIMMEHGMFFALLMPGPALAAQRSQAEHFQGQFASHLARLRGARLGSGDYGAFNRTTADLVRRFIDFKRAMQSAQASGRLNSLVWPSFFNHTANEAERFVRRLDQLSRGDAGYVRGEVVPFWADKMEEHALFVAHLLDIDEKALVGAANTTADAFARMEAAPPASKDPVMRAVEGIIDFKTAAARGIQTGQIKSIIHPALADHVRREAIRFKDELMRAA